jgi:hypothetical protein
MTAILNPRTTAPAETTSAPLPVEPGTATPIVATPVPAAQIATAPAPTAPPAVRRTAWVSRPRDVRLYGALMFALFALSQVVIPPPDGPNPVRPQWVSALDTVTTFGLLALLVGTVAGRRWTLWAGLAVGVPMLTVALSCPLTGHHVYAAWFWVHLAATAAMTALSVVLLRRARAS